MDVTKGKVMTEKEAINTFVHDGDVIIGSGHVTFRRPYGLVREIIRQGKKNLYLEGGGVGGDMDLLIGAGLVTAYTVSYMANAGYSQVLRRFRDAIENGKILFEDYSLDAQVYMYHAAALGVKYLPVKNMLGTDILNKWGISEEERKKHPKLPPKKYILQDNPFEPGDKLVLLPTPQIDVALIHAQYASPDGTFRIEGSRYHDTDVAIAAKHTIISCDYLVSDEFLRRNPELNSGSGLYVDAIVHIPYGAHPSQCFNVHDYDAMHFREYEKASATQEDFDKYLEKYVYNCRDNNDYLDVVGGARLTGLKVEPGFGYRRGLKRK